jgi:hypothetical protein
MTSWIKVQPKKALVKSSLLFETTDSDLCTDFNQFLYAYLYSVSEDKTLEVYDLNNSVSLNYPLLKSTFVDMSGVKYVDGIGINTMSTKRSINRVMQNVRSMPLDTVRSRAQALFQWNPSLIPALQSVLAGSNLPAEFDLGVHIHVGDNITTRDRRAVTVDEYVRAVKKIQGDSKKETLDIFLMSDSANAIAEFKKKADSSWTIYNLPFVAKNDPMGRSNRSLANARLNAYRSFMTELLIMQSISNIVCLLSNSVGRFLYLTVEFPERIVSLDQKFAII